jgi:hypothetical protein
MQRGIRDKGVKRTDERQWRNNEIRAKEKRERKTDAEES